LQPEVGSSGTNRYQTFGDADVEMAMLVRFGQQLGFTLREITIFKNEFGDTEVPIARQREIMSERLAAVELQMASLRKLRTYLQRKIAWSDDGAIGTPPQFIVPERMSPLVDPHRARRS